MGGMPEAEAKLRQDLSGLRPCYGQHELHEQQPHLRAHRPPRLELPVQLYGDSGRDEILIVRDHRLNEGSPGHCLGLLSQVWLGSMLLTKSFCTRDQNFFWLYTRFSCKNVRDLTASTKTHWRPR